MVINFIVYGNTVSKSNSYRIAGNRLYKTQAVKDWELLIKQSASVTKPQNWMHTQSYNVSVKIFWPNKRRKDIDNISKSLLDSMAGILYEDDSQVQELHLYRGFDKQNPRIEVSVEYT